LALQTFLVALLTGVVFQFPTARSRRFVPLCDRLQ